MNALQPGVAGNAKRQGRRGDAGKHQAILRHARRMFAEFGIASTSMDELAKAAGVSKATIYNHFDGKQALFDAILEDLLQQLPLPADLIDRTQGTLAERLTATARAACALATSPLMRDIQRMLALPLDGAHGTGASFWRKCAAPYQRELACMLDDEVHAGRLSISDTRMASSQFFSLAASESFIRMLTGAATDTTTSSVTHVEAAVRTFLRAYACEPAPGRARGVPLSAR